VVVSEGVGSGLRGSAGVVVGLDNGGTANNATVMTQDGNFLVDRLVEVPSRVADGPAVAVEALVEALETVLVLVSVDRSAVRAVGLDTPGPASPDGVISSRGSTNFGHPGWRGFDVRSALEARLQVPVVYNNDANAAALYAHVRHFGVSAGLRSSVAAIVGTGLGGGVIERGRLVTGATGMAAELGHVLLPTEGLLEPGQPVPSCNCGQRGDVESYASLLGIQNNLLPYWLTVYPAHELHGVDPVRAARAVRGLGERGDELALKIFEQQARALGVLFTIASNFTDPDAYFVGGGVVETAPSFREWYLGAVADATNLREEQRRVSDFAIVPDLDMAGARGSAIAALAALA
jgi:predicted NBD/HSP70 family sugar kinase